MVFLSMYYNEMHEPGRGIVNGRKEIMRIIISPAKKMRVRGDLLPCRGLPVFLEQAEVLAEWIRGLSYEEAKALWKCNDRIAEQNYQRYQEMDLRRGLTPSVLFYEGIQYQYMAPAVLDEKEVEYIQDHLRILSGFYGVLRPLDGITPYRLEMQAKASVPGCRDLYEFWGDLLYREVRDESRTILNLASQEYSRCIERYLEPEDRYITCVFGEVADGKVRQKGTLAKMARGEMVRFLAERGLDEPEAAREFDRLGYRFREDLSTEKEYVFAEEKQ